MKDKLKKYLLPNLPYLFFVYLFDKLCQAVRLAPGLDASEKLLHIGQGFQTAFASSAPSFHALDICVGILGAVLVRLTVYVKGKNAKKYRKGIEYGSARWGTAADIAPYVDPVPDWNIPLTRTESLTMTSRPKQPKYARNKNILVIGGSGSGKTRFFVKPSIMQMHSSYVITDPKGQLLTETGKMLLHGAPKLDENGKPVRDRRGRIIYEPYRIRVLNTINFSKSMKYNPLAYVRSEKDILKLVNVIIANTKGDGEKSSEDFWVKAERLLYCALIGYIWYEAEPEERNFITLLDLLNACEAREDDETYKSPVDILFDDLAKKRPEHFAVKQYVKFKMAAGKTLKSILVSCGARLAPFDNIILTSKYGKTKCATAKVVAGIITAILTTTLIAAFNLLLAFVFYGTEGLDCSILFAPSDYVEAFIPFNITCGTLLKYQILLAFTCTLSVTGITLFLSAISKNQIVALVAAMAIFLFPVLLPITEVNPLFRLVGLLPIYHVLAISLLSVEQMSNGMLYAIWAIPAALLFLGVGAGISRRVFAKHQVL